jgi:hypothetical protein
MTLELARLEEWTHKFQPSLIARAQRVANTAARNIAIKGPHTRAQHVSRQDVRNTSITRAFARGFVTCGDCGKPRVIYSDTAPSRMLPLVSGWKSAHH